MKYIDENNGTFSYFTYKKLNNENKDEPWKILFSFKNTSPTYFKDYFNWKYFSDKEKELLYKATEWVLSFKTTKELSNDSHKKMKSWELVWNKSVSENKKNEFFDFSYEIGIFKNRWRIWSYTKKYIKYQENKKMDYNGNLVSVFIDNYDPSVDYITNEPKKSLYVPLFFDGYYYHLIRLTTQIPTKDEKNTLKSHQNQKLN
ncbi:hypothetical protein [Spiroplasma endosymbiont of Ammophila pubescens]|uniref:hypothetical protein n=1 Tax=Spiroplasma endosymbiont of Ammophila pubescens TaxID=3066315 RepID=UPI0032B2979E